jgi:hypothetical protein
MKKISIIFSAFLFSLSSNAQDTITMKNGKVINAHIIEKSDSNIKYKTDSITYSHTTFIINLTNIRTIHYSNGDVDLLSSQNPRSILPLGINGGVGIRSEGIFFNGSIDYLFTPNISAEISFGSIAAYTQYNYYYYSFGGKYWFASKYNRSGFSPFAGLFYGSDNHQNFIEVPVGISYITKFGLQTSLQLSYAYFSHDQDVVPIIEFKVGWRFK